MANSATDFSERETKVEGKEETTEETNEKDETEISLKFYRNAIFGIVWPMIRMKQITCIRCDHEDLVSYNLMGIDGKLEKERLKCGNSFDPWNGVHPDIFVMVYDTEVESQFG
ncbi:hypothetical protein PR202_gb26123 [Eleusine coracana subsp. coracana]|uniref:Uncharacterized protein n=1 Tax=Eleusine coracana subsp. coracana TaxID=191504 RepID=A0AAV5FRS9_ELECO|nr:hypothetical protein PR202_gb26123 [Eleusine coracana subsp. coracana]